MQAANAESMHLSAPAGPEYRHVENLDNALAEIVASGGRVLRSAIVLPSGLGALARVRDHEGKTLNLFSARRCAAR